MVSGIAPLGMRPLQDVESILQDPKLWGVLMLNEHVREILRKEGAENVDGVTPATPKSGTADQPLGIGHSGVQVLCMTTGVQ